MINVQMLGKCHLYKFQTAGWFGCSCDALQDTVPKDVCGMVGLCVDLCENKDLFVNKHG